MLDFITLSLSRSREIEEEIVTQSSIQRKHKAQDGDEHTTLPS